MFGNKSCMSWLCLSVQAVSLIVERGGDHPNFYGHVGHQEQVNMIIALTINRLSLRSVVGRVTHSLSVEVATSMYQEVLWDYTEGRKHDSPLARMSLCLRLEVAALSFRVDVTTPICWGSGALSCTRHDYKIQPFVSLVKGADGDSPPPIFECGDDRSICGKCCEIKRKPRLQHLAMHRAPLWFKVSMPLLSLNREWPFHIWFWQQFQAWISRRHMGGPWKHLVRFRVAQLMNRSMNNFVIFWSPRYSQIFVWKEHWHRGHLDREKGIISNLWNCVGENRMNMQALHV